MPRYLVFLFLFLLANAATAQDRNKMVQDFKDKLKTEKSDSGRVYLLNKIAWNISYNNLDSGLYYSDLAEKLALFSGQHKQLGGIYNTMATIHQDKGNLSVAADYFEKSIDVHKRNNNQYGLGVTYGNLANLEGVRGHSAQAKSYLFTALQILANVNEPRSSALISNNLALNYRNENNLDSALYFVQLSIKISEERKYSDLVGSGYLLEGEILCKTGRDKEGFEKMMLGKKLVDIRKEPYLMVPANESFGSYWMNKKQWNRSLPYLDEAIHLAENIGMNEALLRIYKIRSEVYENMGRTEKALEDFKKFSALNEKIKDAASIEKLNHLTYKMETERKSKEIELLRKNAKIQELDNENQNDKIRIQKLIITGGTILFLLVILLVFNLFRSNKIKQKNNALLSKQKEEIEIKNKEIVDSISYARRLQHAILPPEQLFAQVGEYFLIYQPKDIVAGDFYWFTSVNETSTGEQAYLFAVADCTGHGVPGAMVSVVCHNALNAVVNELGIFDPGKILDKVRENVVDTFAKSGEKVRDGMDISLCCLYPSNLQLKWAGANNPLWLIPSGKQDELIEYKADKQAIGKTEFPKPFQTHAIQLQKGDTLYLFSDGFADQFGGEKGKKLKSSNFRNMLLQQCKLPMQQQAERITNNFSDFKGAYEQVDDICVLGIRI